MISGQSKSRQQIRQINRAEKKHMKKLEKAEALTVVKIKDLLQEVLFEDRLNKIAIKSKFLQRNA